MQSLKNMQDLKEEVAENVPWIGFDHFAYLCCLF